MRKKTEGKKDQKCDDGAVLRIHPFKKKHWSHK